MADSDEKHTSMPSRAAHDRAPTPNNFRLAGVKRVEALSTHTTVLNRICLYAGVLLCATAYGLDRILRWTYAPNVTSALGDHAALGTVGVVQSVIAAAAQPAAARIADVFGRFELILASIVFYAIGTTIEATCRNIPVYIIGTLLYQIGYTCITLLVEIVIADTTTLRSRLFFSYIPALPWLYNVWSSGSIIAIVNLDTFWRWGMGMWAIIFPFSCMLLLFTLWWLNHKAARAGSLNHIRTPLQQYGGWELVKVLYWQLDVVGTVLIVLVFGCILVPLTTAYDPTKDRSEAWTHGSTLAPLIFGFFLIPFFGLWERSAPYPLVPFHLLKDRAVWGALGIATTFNFAFSIQSDYLNSILRVAFDETQESATRITTLYGFVSVITGILVGLVVYRIRRLKPFILFGTILWLVAFGLMIRFRGGESTSAHVGIVFAQVLLGIGGGFFPYAALASIQTATKHENLAVITSLYLSVYSIGAALGNCLSAAIWTQVLPDELTRRLGPQAGLEWYTRMIEVEERFPLGTKERTEVIEALKMVQRLICIAGVSTCVLLIFFAMVIRNPRLPDEQSMPEDDECLELGEHGRSDWERQGR